MTCPTCGHVNTAGQKFCGECGTPLQAACPSCGHVNPPGQKFCGECGTPLSTDSTRMPTASPPTQAAPSAERRLVSVLFADLVGFTTASEGRDAEDTRDLLSRYFDVSRSVIERYGGTVEKFIGDAVMAVWGTPVATEDDAERAVRAALELVDAIPELHPDLRARAGVLTGEAAVTIGASSEGMVAGDLVNTASRVQSAAEPGSVLVGESTRAAADAAIAFEDTGEHDMKGKAEPMRLWRALRVVANRGGEGRSSGLEAPFVGRDRELRLVKDAFQTSAESGHAHLTLVSGPAGIGKSRLSWEFEKYVDGLTLTVWWHKGRCLSYGEGVAYWALSEMVRGRAGILENEETAVAQEKLHASVATHVSTESDREWVEPRLAHLLGLADATFERDDLFAAWRLFFESMADQAPTVLVFEDLQWADAGLLDFVEHLVEWARAKPIFVVGLARPELAERRPGFGTTTRGGFTGLALEPLSDEAMDALLDGLVPGLPESLRASIRARAEGIPLYAVETVRMLMNRGQLEQADGAYRVVGEIASLEVPETLHALVASRIDGLDADERRLVQDAAILGKTFVLEALASVSRRPQDEVEQALEALVRKEILFLEADPRSAQRGQYGFLQDLVRHVAYETLAKRDRKVRHVAAATFFETSWPGREQEIVEMVAAHYVTALELDPQADDAPTLRTKARETLARAGERAASLGASAEAGTLFGRAADLAESPLEAARLLAQAGNAARAHGDTERARTHLLRAIELFEQNGDVHAAARASADLAQGEFVTGNLAEAIERLERAVPGLDPETDADSAFVLSQLGRWMYFAGRTDESRQYTAQALDAAERLHLPETLSHALNTQGLLEMNARHWETARALLRHALELALENDQPQAALRAYANLGTVEARRGNYAEWEELAQRSLELAKRIGDRESEWFSIGHLSEVRFFAGKWDEVVQLASEIPPGLEVQASVVQSNLAEIGKYRGDAELCRQALANLRSLANSAAVQDRAIHASVQTAVLFVDGRFTDCIELLEGFRPEFAKDAMAVWVDILIVESALAGGDVARAEAALASEDLEGPSGDPLVDAMLTRYRACVDASRGHEEHAEDRFKMAAAAFREYGMPFYLACTGLEHAEWLVSAGRADEAAPLLSESRETFERLRATPWLERAERVRSRIPAPTPALA